MRNGLDSRIQQFIFWMAVPFVLLVARLYYLQVIEGAKFLERSESNFIQERKIKHSRGKILDSEGQVLVDNRLAYDLYVTFALLPDSLANLKAIAAPLLLSRKEITMLNQELLERAVYGVDEDILIADKISKKTCHDIYEIARVKMISGVKVQELYLGHDNYCRVLVNTMNFPSHYQAFTRLSRMVAVKSDNLRESWESAQKKSRGLGRFKPSLLTPDIGFQAYAQIENAISLGRLAGITVVPSKRRRYIYDNFASHVLGYLNQVSLSDIQNNSEIYKSGDSIGRRGVEGSFEKELRGVDGVESVIVDAKGRRFHKSWEEGLLGQDRIREPQSGSSIKLSINFELQKAAEELFTERSGSVIVVDVNTGFILALASFPTFNPNILVKGDNSEELQKIFNDEDRPFRNKALQDHYSPGSTFKLITGISGLANKMTTLETDHYCNGLFRIHKTVWRCYKREGHGTLRLAEALKASCDSYFYDLGRKLGLENLAKTASDMGFGKKTGISLAGETSGILPTKEYYKKRFGYTAPGFVVNMSIGQGDLSVTPLQLAMAYAAIANGGTLYQPQLVKEIVDSNNQVLKEFDKVVVSKISDPNVDFAMIRNGISNVTDPGGSASGIRYNPKFSDIASWMNKEKIKIVGKTGTAQVVKMSKAIDHLIPEDVPYKFRDNAWFAGLFPEKDPQIAIIAMTEHGGFAASASAPVVIRLMRKWDEMTRVKISSLVGEL